MHEKFIIYQVLPRLFGNTNEFCVPNSSLEVNGTGKLSDFTPEKLLSIKELGCTHIWYTGVLEHATKCDYSTYGIPPNNPSVVKGIAGSPYAVRDYYDISPDLADNVSDRLNEFRDLIIRSHKAGLSVIMDFVPNHVSREYYSDQKPYGEFDFGARDNTDEPFTQMNNYYYLKGEKFISPVEDIKNPYTEYPARATGNDCFKQDPALSDWYETVKLNYGVDYISGGEHYFDPVPDTWQKMLKILRYWCEFGVDGFRCDMAEMVPVEFWNWSLGLIKDDFPGIIFIGEIYNPDSYSDYLSKGKFDYLYDKVGMYDYLKQVSAGDKPASGITRCWQDVNDFQDRMLNFMENHDEQRIASDFFLGKPEKALPALAVSLLLNRSPFMIYFGQELGERGMDNEGYSGIDGRTSIFDYWSVSAIRDWHKGIYNISLRGFYKQLLSLALNEKAFRKGSTYDLEHANLNNPQFDPFYNYAFVRKYENELILVIVNFSDKMSCLDVNLPENLFSHFQIDNGKSFSGRDLLKDEIGEHKLSSSEPFKISVEKRGVKVIKLLLQEYHPN